jgi:hypothetical protein
MHRGICTAANLDNLVTEGLTISDLSHLAEMDFFKEKFGVPYTLDVLKDKEIVVDFSKLGWREKKYGIPYKHPYIPAYVELNRGYGSSDDASFNFASLMFTMEAGFGLIMMDAVDTIDKCLPYIKERGEDEVLGQKIFDRMGGFAGLERNLNLSKQDVLNLIFAAAIDKDHPEKWPSCSQRRFLQYTPQGNYALLNHMDHIKHISDGMDFPENIQLSIKEIPSHQFFNAFKGKINFMLKNDLIDYSKVPNPERFANYFKLKS